MTAIRGEYVTFKHIKTRKVVVLEIETAEENFQNVINTLGMPVGGESKPVGIALLVPIADDETVATSKLSKEELLTYSPPLAAHPTQFTVGDEGDKLRVRAVMLCKDEGFQEYMKAQYGYPESDCYYDNDNEGRARATLVGQCNIKSRKELVTNIAAQEKFKKLDQEFKQWQTDERYKNNLERER